MTTAAPAQNYGNHRKFVPGYHGVAFGILAINFFYSLYVVVTAFSVASVIALLLAFGLIMVMFYARLFALGAQDRVIRLEEKLRLRDLLPPEQKHTINKLTTEQLIGLRFASLSANVRETRSTQRIRVGRRQRKRTCWDCEREWKRMVVPLEPGRPSEARQLLRTQR